jgi:hypothetical protein
MITRNARPLIAAVLSCPDLLAVALGVRQPARIGGSRS